MMKYAVYGGGGFVGSEFLRVTTNDCVKMDRNDYSFPDDCNSVVNFISTVHNYNVFTNPHVDVDTNLSVLMKLLEAWKNNPKSKSGVFVLISSWFVYGSNHGPQYSRYDMRRGADEFRSCEPKGFYSITKYTAELLLKSFCETFGLKYMILRLANVVGKGDPKVSAQKNALQYLIEKLKNNETIELYNDGDFYRDYIHVHDCARAIDCVLTQNRGHLIVNIGSGKPSQFRYCIDIARQIISSSSEIRKIKPKEFHKKVQGSKSFYMNTSILHQVYDFAPKYDTIEKIIYDLI